MTVLPSGSDVADKAVSTEDASNGGEVVRLEAVLAALVETKVEAMKASALSNKKSGSAPPSPRRPRLTSSSTASSSQNHQHRQHHRHPHHRNRHHHQQQQQQQQTYHRSRHRDNERAGSHGEHPRRETNKKESHRYRRHDSAPCGEYIEDPTTRDHRKHRSEKTRRRRASDTPPSPRYKRRHSKSPNVPHDANSALDSRFELFDMDGDQDLALINFERSREALGESCDYSGIHQSACYFPHSAAHLKIHYDQDDYVALTLDDAFEDQVSLNGRKTREDKRERFHRPRRKKKRKRRIVETIVPEEEYVDPEELPPRARWTIVATACLLLAMSLLLVGVTLRMAPIIDDMGDGRRASVCRKAPSRRASSAAGPPETGSRRKSSVRPTTRIEIRETCGKVAVKSPLELEQARRHRRVAIIIIGTFSFLLMASILAVVVTLTHSSFHTPPLGSREAAEDRLNLNYHPSDNDTLRKENEELLNSLNRDDSVAENSTASL